MTDPKNEIRAALKPASLVGAAILACLLVYLALAEVLRAAQRPFRGFAALADMQPVRIAVFGAGAAAVLAILLLRPRLFRRRETEDVPAALRRLQRGAIVMLVLGEMPAVLGLALFLVGGNAGDFRACLIVSLVLTFINFPRAAAWEEWLKG